MWEYMTRIFGWEFHQEQWKVLKIEGKEETQKEGPFPKLSP